MSDNGTEPVDLTADIIDSRDIIARIEYLQEGHEVPEDYPVRVLDEDETAAAIDPAQCGMCERWWDDGVSTGMTPTPSGRCPFEAYHLDEDERTELATLREVAAEGESLADWQYGEALIRDSYFEDYARELAEDIGLELPKPNQWPYAYVTIDWERAADALLMDYTSIEIDGTTYYGRS